MSEILSALKGNWKALIEFNGDQGFTQFQKRHLTLSDCLEIPINSILFTYLELA